MVCFKIKTQSREFGNVGRIIFVLFCKVPVCRGLDFRKNVVRCVWVWFADVRAHQDVSISAKGSRGPPSLYVLC